jgi:hypothetical protein
MEAGVSRECVSLTMWPLFLLLILYPFFFFSFHVLVRTTIPIWHIWEDFPLHFIRVFKKKNSSSAYCNLYEQT